MTQRELYHEVARTTGESFGTISGMGFSLVETPTRRNPRGRPGARARWRMRRRLKVRATPARKPLFALLYEKIPGSMPMPRVAA